MRRASPAHSLIDDTMTYFRPPTNLFVSL